MPAPYFDPDAPDDGDDEFPATGGAPVFNPDADTDGTPANGNAVVQPRAADPDSDEGLLDYLAQGVAGVAEGATMGHLQEIGNLGLSKLGRGVGNLTYDAVQGLKNSQLFSDELPSDRLERNVVSTGQDDADLDGLLDEYARTPVGRVGQAVGGIGTAAAGGIAAGPSFARQALTGAGMGGLSAGGATDHDPLAMLGGAALGGVLSAAGAGAGKLLQMGKNALAGSAPAATNPTRTASQMLMEGVPSSADEAIIGGIKHPLKTAGALRRGATVRAIEGANPNTLRSMGQVAATLPGSTINAARAEDSPLDVQVGDAQMLPPYRAEIGEAEPRGAYRADIGEAQLLDELASPEGTAFARLQDEARQMRAPDQYGAQIPSYGGTIGQTPFSETELRKSGGFYPTSETPGEDVTVTSLRRPGDAGVDIGDAQIKAYAGVPSLTYAVHRVLSSDEAGLPDEARDQMTRAALAGDTNEVKSLHFRFSQRYPGYARKAQEQIDALNMED